MKWQAHVYEVFEDQKRDEKARQVKTFSFDAESVDAAEPAAKKWLTDRKLLDETRRVRSFSHLAGEERAVAIVVSVPRLG